MDSISQRKIPVQEGLFTWPAAEPQLIASKCKACGDVVFPKQLSCPDCSGDEVEEILLSRRGAARYTPGRSRTFLLRFPLTRAPAIATPSFLMVLAISSCPKACASKDA